LDKFPPSKIILPTNFFLPLAKNPKPQIPSPFYGIYPKKIGGGENPKIGNISDGMTRLLLISRISKKLRKWIEYVPFTLPKSPFKNSGKKYRPNWQKHLMLIYPFLEKENFQKQG